MEEGQQEVENDKKVVSEGAFIVDTLVVHLAVQCKRVGVSIFNRNVGVYDADDPEECQQLGTVRLDHSTGLRQGA